MVPNPGTAPSENTNSEAMEDLGGSRGSNQGADRPEDPPEDPPKDPLDTPRVPPG